MIIYILDGLNGVADFVDVFESAIWNVQFWDLNDFELTAPGTLHNISALAVGRLLCLEKDVTEDPYTFRNVMQIETRELTYNAETGWRLKVSGAGLKKIVGQRIVWTQTNLTGSIETGIRSVITDNIISPSDSNRAISNFILASAAGISGTFDVQLFGENIAEWLQSIGASYGFGWDVYISAGKYVFELKKGTDRSFRQNTVQPVVFSPDYDNLLSSVYTYSKADYKNAALVGGEGEGTSQRTATVGTASGLNRYEAYIDGGSVSSNGEIITPAQYTVLLQNYGQEQLDGTAFTEKFEGEMVPNGLYKLERDYFLGDVVQIINDHGMSASSRIIEIIYSEDRNGVSYIPTFSDMEGA